MSPPHSIRLISEDGKSYVIPLRVGCLSEFVKTAIGGDDDDDDDDDDDKDNLDYVLHEDNQDPTNDESIPEIPVPKVSSSVLERVIEFCYYHVMEEPMDPIEQGPLRSPNMMDVVRPTWYATFITSSENNTRDMLLALLEAANFMDIKPLLELTGATIASQIEGFQTEEMREYFNIQNDFTPEEEARIRSEFQWCEEAEENCTPGDTPTTTTNTTV